MLHVSTVPGYYSLILGKDMGLALAISKALSIKSVHYTATPDILATLGKVSGKEHESWDL